MANMSQALHAAPASRVRTALISAVLAALALVGGLLLSFKVGSLAAAFLEGRVPRQYVIPLTTLAASTVMLSGSALWAIGTPLYAYLKVLWRAQAAEKRARSERLARLAIEARLEQTVEALSITSEGLFPACCRLVSPPILLLW